MGVDILPERVTCKAFVIGSIANEMLVEFMAMKARLEYVLAVDSEMETNDPLYRELEELVYRLNRRIDRYERLLTQKKGDSK